MGVTVHIRADLRGHSPETVLAYIRSLIEQTTQEPVAQTNLVGTRPTPFKKG